jgi:hypothetical protein
LHECLDKSRSFAYAQDFGSGRRRPAERLKFGAKRQKRKTRARPTCAPSPRQQETDRTDQRREALAVWSVATEMMEARVGIEPTHKGFADLSLTTWVPRPCAYSINPRLRRGQQTRTAAVEWSGRRDLNPRLRPWQGRTLPLSYSRSGLKMHYIVMKMQGQTEHRIIGTSVHRTI